MPKTLEDLKALEAMDCIFLTPAQAAPYIGANPGTLRWQAQNEPHALGFPVIQAKRRTKIPRVPFIRFLRGEERRA